MTLQLSTITPKVSTNNGKVITTSQDVADYFRKLHKDILKKIKFLDYSPEFNKRNFAPVDYIDGKGEKRPMYEMTKNGFIFLVMGFTGKKAAQFKEAYIAEFNRMETELNSNLQDNLTYTEVIYVDKGKVVRTQRLEKDELVASIEHFMQIARKAGYIVVKPEELLEKLVQSNED